MGCYKKIISDELSTIIANVIKTLNGLEIIIFALKIERNLTFKDIGNRLSLSHETIRKYYNKIIKKIKKEV